MKLKNNSKGHIGIGLPGPTPAAEADIIQLPLREVKSPDGSSKMEGTWVQITKAQEKEFKKNPAVRAMIAAGKIIVDADEELEAPPAKEEAPADEPDEFDAKE